MAPISSRRLAVAAAACLALGSCAAAQAGGTLYDDFSKCPSGGHPSGAMWEVPRKQWGGTNVNGGVDPANVQCVMDSTLGKPVLQLTASGDKFTGSGPTGVLKNGDPRPNNAEFTGWLYGAYKAPCTPHCDVRRVGGAIQSKQTFSGGHLTIHMKPCPQFGVTSAAWLFNYTEHYCDPSKSSCSPAYQKQCCGGQPCTLSNDVCQGAWYENLEIDIELPTSDAGVMPRSIDPNWITYHNVRFSSYTALRSDPHAKCGSVTPCSQQQYEFVGAAQNDGKYHTYELFWDTSAQNLTFAVDGRGFASVTGANKVPDLGQLWLGAWIPNSWAGSPDFDTCQLLVDYVKLEPL